MLAWSCLSVCLSARDKSAPTERIFIKFDISVFFENRLRKLKFNEDLTRLAGASHEDRCTLMVISR